jgi:hypothetical protein
MVTLLGISHGGYLAYKATPHTPSADRKQLAHLSRHDILVRTRFSVGGLPASAARQTPQSDARPTTKTPELPTATVSAWRPVCRLLYGHCIQPS